jgi:hypothetical protein
VPELEWGSLFRAMDRERVRLLGQGLALELVRVPVWALVELARVLDRRLEQERAAPAS